MLQELHIENIAVIERADISFSQGLNILTGETGAGKSIVIDSLGAVLGGRVSRELVRHGADKASVTAVFEPGPAEDWLRDNGIEAEEELILQRRISDEGKSACRVCGVPVTAAQLKELGALLIDVHGQNDGRQLMDERLHGAYLDRFGHLENELAAFQTEYRAYSAVKKEIARLSMDEVEKERLSESLRYQIAELERADLKAGEKDALISRRDLLRNSEKLTEALDQALAALSGGDENAISLSQNAESFAFRAATFAPELEKTVSEIHEAAFALADASEALRDYREGFDFSPEEYDAMETRLAMIGRLERKYGRSSDSLPAYLEECREKLDGIQYAEERLEKLRKDLAAQKKRCQSTSSVLHAARERSAKELQRRVETEGLLS